MKRVSHLRQKLPYQNRRRAAVLVWFVYVIPLMMLLLFALTDYGATARTGIELKNAVDAAALSAVKSWSALGPDAARRDADAAFQGNAVLGTHRALRSTNADARSPDYTGPSTEVTLGLLEARAGRHVFHPLGTQTLTSDRLRGPANSVFSTTTTKLCARVRRSVMMSGVGQAWKEAAFGTYSITAESYARIGNDQTGPQLVHVDQVSVVDGSWEGLP